MMNGCCSSGCQGNCTPVANGTSYYCPCDANQTPFIPPPYDQCPNGCVYASPYCACSYPPTVNSTSPPTSTTSSTTSTTSPTTSTTTRTTSTTSPTTTTTSPAPTTASHSGNFLAKY